MIITLNGKRAETSAPTIAALLEESGAPNSGIAVALNESVVRRADWPSTPVAEGDKVEVIRAVQGG